MDPPLPQAFHVILKPRGAICNLDCAYCFYLRKETLYPQASFRMSDELLEVFTRQYIQAQNVPELTFAWQGGEPTLMGIDFYRKAIDLQRKYRRPGQKILNSLQTNAVLLDEEWCCFFKQHNFLLGVSLDGPRELHDIYRLDKAGHPTFESVMHGIRLLQKYGVEFNILACVNNHTACYPLEIYHFFRDEVSTHYVQFIPIVEKITNPVFPNITRSVSGVNFGQFLNAIFDDWVRNDVGKVFIQLFDVALAAWAGFPSGLCVHEAVCGRALAMEHNGDLYSCDHFVDSEHFLGNVIEHSLVELITLPAQRKFGRDKKGSLPRQCQRCRVRFACHGGCPKDRLLVTQAGEPGLNLLCEGYRAFFSHINRPMRRMVELLQANRAPAEIMEELRIQETSTPVNKTGRKRHKKSEYEVSHV
jgi:uncharacterized protein